MATWEAEFSSERRYRCPDCEGTSAGWTTGETYCDDCGDHPAAVCPLCEHRVDMVYHSVDEIQTRSSKMGMSLHVSAVRDLETDKVLQKMLKVRAACIEAGMVPPQGVIDYFEEAGVDWSESDEDLISELEETSLDDHPCCTEYLAEMQEGYEIDLTQLPEGITRLRFVASF